MNEKRGVVPPPLVPWKDAKWPVPARVKLRLAQATLGLIWEHFFVHLVFIKASLIFCF